MAERPNRTFGDMMRSLLHGARLGPEYWSWALLHAVYLKNHLPHRAIGTTPYQAYTGRKPDLHHLKIFGSPIVSRLPGQRPAKLDHHIAEGIFLGYTATSHNIYYRDKNTKKVKIAMHVTFDEAGYTLVPAQCDNWSSQAVQLHDYGDTATSTKHHPNRRRHTTDGGGVGTNIHLETDQAT